MANFLTNIQLQDADRRDYDVLYGALENELFKNEKHDADRKAYAAEKPCLA